MDNETKPRLVSKMIEELSTHADRGGLDGFDPDHQVEAVDAAVAEVGDPRRRERARTRRRAASSVALQAGLDGGVRLYGELDPLTGAVVVNALDAAVGRPTPTPADGDPSGAAHGGDPAGRPPPHGHRHARIGAPHASRVKVRDESVDGAPLMLAPRGRGHPAG